MAKATKKSVGAQQVRRNFSSSEVEVLLQEITRRRKYIFSSHSAGYTSTNKKETWEAVTRAVDAVSGEGHTIEEVKKNGLILILRQKKKHCKIPMEDATDWRGNSRYQNPV